MNPQQPITKDGASVKEEGWFYLNVLIVEDSKVLQERMAEMLRGVPGLNLVGQARSVVDARRMIQELQPDIVILDLQLPDGNGIDILRETKRDFPLIRFVIFTNQCEPQYRQRCLELGADYFLCKSTEAKSLLAISKVLAADERHSQ